MDIISFSARDEIEIKKTFYHYIDSAERVIISRPSYASPISNELKSKLHVVNSKSDNILFRLKDLLEESAEKFVFLAADDDYIFKDRLKELSILLNDNTDTASARIMTCALNRPEAGVIEIIPYLNSPKVSKMNRQYGDFRKNGKALVNENFHPLCIDFYTFLNREKLLFILTELTKLDTETIDRITSAGKILQFLLSFGILLSGTIVDYQYPVYLRGEAKPIRYSEKYINRGTVEAKHQSSFANEFKHLLKSKSSWVKVISTMNKIYERYGHETSYRFHSIKEKRMLELSNALLNCLQTTCNSINLNLLSAFEDNYRVRMSNAESQKTNIVKDEKSIIFQLNPAKSQFKQEIISKFSNVWEGFILETLSQKELNHILNITL